MTKLSHSLKHLFFTTVAVAMFLLLFGACNQSHDNAETNVNTIVEDSSTSSQNSVTPFSADTAYAFIEKQVAFGPRVPNSEGHRSCRNWLIGKLEQYGAKVYAQDTKVRAYDSTELAITNIIGAFNPDAEERILLLAHWDTRPEADFDPNPSLKSKPIIGADDGGSGVAVLLEIARIIQSTDSKKGIDIFFTDAEDYGAPHIEDSWCLGSTYWSLHPHVEGYKAKYGILLDMVGAKDARFRWESFSKLYAPDVLDAVWSTAASLGYGRYFIQADGGALTDDHVPINKNMGIPTIDIVNYDPSRTKGFGEHWHTHADNISVIDRNVLSAVGNTVWSVITK